MIKIKDLTTSEIILFVVTIIGILGTCHIYPDGNGKTLLVLTKVLISNLTNFEINLEKVHSNNSQFTQIMTACSLSNLPEGLHPKDLIKNLKLVENNKNIKIDYLDLVKDQTNFFEDYGANFLNKLVILKGIITDSKKDYMSLSKCLPEYQELQRFFEESCERKNYHNEDWILNKFTILLCFLNQKVF